MLREIAENRAIMEIVSGASHVRTNRPHWNLTVPAWQGVYSTPLHPHDQGEPSCPPVEPPEQGISLPMHPGPGQYNFANAEMFLPQPKEISFSLGTHDR